MLVSCNGTTPSQDVKFLIQESSVTLNDRTIVIHLDWEPSSDIIEFSNFSFTLKNQSDITSTVTLKDASARPLELTNTFNRTLENDDTGSLTFHYHDKTIMKEGEGNVDNILIKLDEPSKDVKFSIEESSLILENQSTTLHLDWEPSSDVIEFNDFNFTLKNQSDITSTVTSKESTTRPLELTITFNSELHTDDIAELTFHYHDKTIKKEGEGKVENININLPTYVEKPIKIVTVDPESYVYETLYEYDEKYRIRKHTANQYSPGGELVYTATIQYTYNEHDDVVTYIESAFGQEYINLSYTYEYDGQGNMITQIEKGTDDGDPVNRKYTFAYDEYNRLLKECVYNIIESNDDELIKQYEYTYTEGKQYKDFETMIEKDATGSIESQVTNTFDEKGRIVKVDDTTRGITENTYDDYDCIIKQKITLSDGIEEATTTYYKNNPEKVLKRSVTTTIWYASSYTLDCEYDSHDRIKKETEINEKRGTSVTTYYYELE